MPKKSSPFGGGNESKSSWQGRLDRMRRNAQAQAKARGFDEGFRSGFELQLAILLKFYKIEYEFETDVIPWVSEPKKHKYTPDFKIRTRSGRVIYIETKGRFEKEDREKHLMIKKQHPELDIRLVFSNPNTWDRKALTRSYGKWATENGFKWTSKAQMKIALKKWMEE